MSTLNTVTPREFWDIAVRRKWLIVGAVLLSLAGAWVVYQMTPKLYRSSTLILVEGQRIPQRYVQAVVESSVQERLSLIQQHVMSRTLLSKLIEEFHPYGATSEQEFAETPVNAMRKNIKIETRGGGRVEAFSISFAHGDPVMAMKVTARLASEFIEENLKAREEFVQGATEFLDEELQRAKEGLEAQEEAVGGFKRKYIGELPGQLEANLRTLDRLQSEHTILRESLNTLNARLEPIEKMVAEYETPGTPGFATEIDPLLVRLKELERNLVILSAEYKATYPDVINLKQEIAKLKTELADRRERIQPIATEPTSKASKTSKTKIFDLHLTGLLRQRDDLQFEIQTIKERINRIAEAMKDYEGRVDRTPSREQELMILVRDTDNMQKNYQSLLEKKLNARIAENLEKRQKGEQFRILDPANLPEQPEQPDLVRIMLIGLLAGCAAGYGSAFAIELYKQPFRRPEEAETFLGYPIIGTIPAFQMMYQHGSLRRLPSVAGLLDLRRDGPSLSRNHLGDRTPGENGRWRGLWDSWRKLRKVEANEKIGGMPRGKLALTLNLVAKWRPVSVDAEQFRVAATRLVLMVRERKSTVVVVTSALKGEGKSATSANLAYILARDLGKSTLLIDCDLKRPMLHAYTDTPLEPGLAEALHGDLPLDECLHGLRELPLTILPAGSTENRQIELFRINRLTDILPQLRTRFEFIIIDAPPILPLADMNVLASLADILTVVVRAEVTERDVVRKALNMLKPTSQVGLILTGLWARDMPYYMQVQYYNSPTKAVRLSGVS